jgi:hypothetical protein
MIALRKITYASLICQTLKKFQHFSNPVALGVVSHQHFIEAHLKMLFFTFNVPGPG